MSVIPCLFKRFATIYIMTFVMFGCSPVNNNHPPVSTASPEQMDESPFSGVPCVAPCWQGLEVGKSSESDVRLVLPTLMFIDQTSLFFHKMDTPTLDWYEYAPGVEITANCINSKRNCLEINISEDILTEINITLDYTIRADEAIAYLGNPSYVGTSPESVHTGTACVVFLIWADSRLVLTSTLYSKSGGRLYDCSIVHHTGKISPGMIIMEVSYLSEAAVQGRIPSTEDLFEFSGFAPEQ